MNIYLKKRQKIAAIIVVFENYIIDQNTILSYKKLRN